MRLAEESLRVKRSNVGHQVTGASLTIKQWTVGGVRITRVQEHAVARPGTMFLAKGIADTVKREGPWLSSFVKENGDVRLSIHALMIESEGNFFHHRHDGGGCRLLTAIRD